MIAKPWLTAIHRKNISVPLKFILDNNILCDKDSILEIGCGHAYDLNHLKQLNHNIIGFDKYIEPYNKTNYKNKKYSKILCFYVINTIVEEDERKNLLKEIFDLLHNDGEAYVAIRSHYEFSKMNKDKLSHYKDGVLTSKKTFQKYYTLEEITSIINSIDNKISIEEMRLNKSTIFLKIYKGVKLQ